MIRSNALASTTAGIRASTHEGKHVADAGKASGARASTRCARVVEAPDFSARAARFEERNTRAGAGA